MQVNVTFNVSDKQAKELITILLGGEKPSIETATVPAPVVEERKKETAKPKAAAKPKPKYTIESIRKASKDVAREKGQPFVKEALDAVGATSISKIEPDKFDDFMNLLNGEK